MWVVEASDTGGIAVFSIDARDVALYEATGGVAFEDEAAAVDYGIGCAEDRRQANAASVASLKRWRRSMKRRVGRAIATP